MLFCKKAKKDGKNETKVINSYDIIKPLENNSIYIFSTFNKNILYQPFPNKKLY